MDDKKSVKIDTVSINDAPENTDTVPTPAPGDTPDPGEEIEKLTVMDAIDAAQKHNPDDAGIQSMAMAMDGAFAQIGITRIESLGQKLNPIFHNAVQVVPAPADATPAPEPNTIIEELQPGYMFGDTVLRTAMVVVSK